MRSLLVDPSAAAFTSQQFWTVVWISQGTLVASALLIALGWWMGGPIGSFLHRKGIIP